MTTPKIGIMWWPIFDRGGVLVYLNGTKFAESKAPFESVAAHGNNGGIGATFDDNSFPDPAGNPGEDDAGKPVGQNVDGLMDEIYIYNRVLSAQEIAEYANALAVEPEMKLTTIRGQIKSEYP